jgi:hypothetical protein
MYFTKSNQLFLELFVYLRQGKLWLESFVPKIFTEKICQNIEIFVCLFKQSINFIWNFDIVFQLKGISPDEFEQVTKLRIQIWESNTQSTLFIDIKNWLKSIFKTHSQHLYLLFIFLSKVTQLYFHLPLIHLTLKYLKLVENETVTVTENISVRSINYFLCFFETSKSLLIVSKINILKRHVN